MKKLKKIILIMIMILLGFTFIPVGFNLDKIEKPIYKYKVEKSHSYEVSLKPNEFYTQNVLSQDNAYASKSINEFKVNFKYFFESSSKTLIKYKYSICAELIGAAKNSDEELKNIWTRDFSLLDEKNIDSEEIDKFSIEETANINYDYYNELVNSYEEAYGISIDATLKVKLNVLTQINLSKFGMETEQIEDYIELNIPLTDTVTEVKANYDEGISKDIIPQNQALPVIFVIIGVVFIFIAICVIIHNLKNKNQTEEEKYTQNIKRIFKYYKDLIVTIKNEPDFEKMKLMKVAIFEDLIDIAEQNQISIIHYEIIKNVKSAFYVIVNEYVYFYEVTANKLD